MKIVALGHRKRVGKDTFARILKNVLREKFGAKVRIVGFADAVKEVAYTLYSWAGLKKAAFYEENPSLINQILEPIGKSPRDLWISVGHGFRQIDSLVWINVLLNGFKPKDLDVLIIKDLRYENEVVMVRQHGGKVIKIQADWVPAENDNADGQLKDYYGWNKIIHNLKDDHEHLYEEAVLLARELAKEIQNG